MKFRLIFLLLICFSGFGQETQIPWENRLLENAKWNQGDSLYPFRFAASINLVTRKVKSGKTNIETEVAEAVWLKDQSWMADSVKAKYAAYSQLLFDCFEYEARRVSGFINAEDVEPEATVLEAIQRAETLNSELSDYTKQGQDNNRFAEMRKWMDSLLAATPRYEIPQFESTNVSLRIDAGVGFANYFGALHSYFDNVSGFAYGAKLKIRRLNFDLYQTGGITVSKKSLDLDDFKFEPGDKLEIRQNSLVFGFDVFRKGRFSISPHGGISSFRIINKEQPKGSIYNRGQASYLIGAGFSASYHTNPFFQDDHLQYCWYVVLRSQYDIVNYLYTIDGQSLRFQLGIGLAFNTIKNVLQD